MEVRQPNVSSNLRVLLACNYRDVECINTYLTMIWYSMSAYGRKQPVTW